MFLHTLQFSKADVFSRNGEIWGAHSAMHMGYTWLEPHPADRETVVQSSAGYIRVNKPVSVGEEQFIRRLMARKSKTINS